MCGIVGAAGFFEPGLMRRMADAVLHRGPDGEGIFEVADAGMALAMRRLAIIDLETGNQPFFSQDGKVGLVFNGEIYNYRDLREELRRRGHSFRTNSDTEVVLASFLEWDDAAWDRLQGMFAVAIVDLRGEPRMNVVRDRVGMKPLYYVAHGGRLVFASELKALKQWSGCSSDVDLEQIRNYLALRYVPGPRSLFRDILKLPAGHQLEFRAGRVKIRPWWLPPKSSEMKAGLGFEESAEELGAAMRLAVRRHMISDVPIGAFLSGGIDSSVIVALMAEASTRPVRTFSIGFHDFPDEDRSLAAVTARAVGAEHESFDCRAEDFTSLPDIAWSLDEPIGDAIVVPMYALSRAARRSVKVVLSGEGADEILGGYAFHRRLVQLEAVRRRLPSALFPVLAALISKVPASLLAPLFDYPGALGSEGVRKVATLLAAARAGTLADLYRTGVSLFDPEDIAGAAMGRLRALATNYSSPALPEQEGTTLQQLISAQFPDWLPDDILMKADKMSMAHSLELRIPFMDEAVIGAAAAIPDSAKLSRGTTKAALRQFARTLLPAEVVSSPKRAFYVPLESYIHAPIMKDLIARSLDPERIRRRGLFRPHYVKALSIPAKGAGFLPLKRLFSIIMLELWFERFAPDASWA